MLEDNRLFKIATLNCWGIPHPWPIGSLHLKYRINKLIDALNNSDYDIITLQEIWSEEDFLRIAHSVSKKLPFSHYFHSGFTGSGVCVLSAYPIISTLQHRYSLNGFAHHIHRGDWFGGKIVGMVELKIANTFLSRSELRVKIYTTHLHAEYDEKNDLYLPHRISQCFELSQFLRHTSQDSDFVILTGDFNLVPYDIGYYLIKNIADLEDAWDCRPNNNEIMCSGATCDRPDNCFTSKKILKHYPDGKRIDYIMFQSKKVGLKLKECEICFDKITDPKPMNFSDHNGVCASFSIDEEMSFDSNSEKMRHISMVKSYIDKSLLILEKGEIRAIRDRRFYFIICFTIGALMIATVNIDFDNFCLVLLVSVIRFFLSLIIGFSLWHCLICLSIEMKAIKETKYSMRKILKHLCE